jgi:glycosyltransferase involved in cell wall biosynthesis
MLVSPEGDAMMRDVAALTAALRDEYDIRVLAVGDEQARFEAAGAAFTRWRPAGFVGMGISISRLRRTVEREQPDVVHAHGFPAIAVALGTFPSRLAKRTIATFHDPQRDKELPKKLVERKLPGYLRRGAALVATYASLARALEQRLLLEDGSIAVIPHAVVEPPGEAPLTRPPARPGPVVGWSGSLSADRAWETAIDAFVKVHAARPEARLQIAGTGRARQFIAAHARHAGVADAVEFRGDVGAAELFAAIDLLVVPMSRDAQPQAPLEALLWGIPAVAANVGALAEAVGPFTTGWLVDDDAEGFRLGIEDAWSKIDEAWAGAAAQRPAAATFGRERVTAAYRALYARALEND